jgi:hypothetical protein
MGRAKLPARFQSNAQFPPFHPAAREFLECLECLSFSKLDVCESGLGERWKESRRVL